MTTRPHASRAISPREQPSSSLLLLAALCLLLMPQSYKGGASLSHPHAIFQFWIPGGHLSADHHHGEDDRHNHDHAAPQTQSSAERQSTTPVRRADTPTISPVTPTAEISAAIGGVLSSWFVLLLAAAAGLFVVRGLRAGLTPSPERPPPRLVPAPS
ncbi:MAG: hypothetical protein QOJ59_1810 [Thermomicrobiales bacterium]|nr:hypothetical protein [Thermomicrobiales bacterium]